MNITVYLGAAFGNDPCLQSEAEKLGAYIGQAGHTLVYGGSHNGLMGVLARSAKNNGARVIGVEPQFFIDAGFVNDDVDELYVTQTMSERKNKMIELGDAFIAFPGGTGTLEEISEVMAKCALRHLSAPWLPTEKSFLLSMMLLLYVVRAGEKLKIDSVDLVEVLVFVGDVDHLP
ncbi:MAG: TIGR00730 family Rossman fold protein, partial [Erysipelotrichaceae bacterium]|nr:TIGR00730 family Rossman fold protein [Erysipelotrichaceae bacterium]